MLRDDDGAFRENTEGPSRQLIEEMGESVILLLLPLNLLRGELQFALQFASEEEVDEDVVILFVQLVLDAHQLEERRLLALMLVQQIQRV
jgi:hypothetical protein